MGETRWGRGKERAVTNGAHDPHRPHASPFPRQSRLRASRRFTDWNRSTVPKPGAWSHTSTIKAISRIWLCSHIQLYTGTHSRFSSLRRLRLVAVRRMAPSLTSMPTTSPLLPHCEPGQGGAIRSRLQRGVSGLRRGARAGSAAQQKARRPRTKQGPSGSPVGRTALGGSLPSPHGDARRLPTTVSMQCGHDVLQLGNNRYKMPTGIDGLTLGLLRRWGSLADVAPPVPRPMQTRQYPADIPCPDLVWTHGTTPIPCAHAPGMPSRL